jgi:hypothetical protein
MSDTPDSDREFLLKEYDRLTGDLMHYYDGIVATERLALAGAAGVVAFLYTDLPSFAVGQAHVLSALPAAIIALAGLRCLSIFMVMEDVARYLRMVEGRVVSASELGYQRVFHARARLQHDTIVVTTTLFWILALAVAVVFWSIYEPAPATAPLVQGEAG